MTKDEENQRHYSEVIHDIENGPDWYHCLVEIEETGTVDKWEDALKKMLDQPPFQRLVTEDGQWGFALTERGRAQLAEYRSEAATEERARTVEDLRWSFFPGTVRVEDNMIQISGEGAHPAWQRELTAEGTAFPRIGTRNAPPPPWQVEGLWHVGDLVLVFGQPDTYKTYLALDWSNCIQRGLAWNGLATKRAPVVYIIAEGQEFFGVRQQAWNMAHDADEADNPFQHDEAVDLLGKASVDSLLGPDELIALLQHDSAGLVVVDTLHRNMSGGSDVSDRDMGRVVEVMDRIKREVGATVLLLHHSGWAAVHERGSNVLRGATDAIFQAKIVNDRMVLTNERMKNAAKAPTFVFDTREVGEALVLEPADGAVAGRMVKGLERIRNVLAAAGDEGLTHAEIATKSGLAKATVTRHLAALEESGEIRKDGRRYVLIVEA